MTIPNSALVRQCNDAGSVNSGLDEMAEIILFKVGAEFKYLDCLNSRINRSIISVFMTGSTVKFSWSSFDL